MSFVITRGPYNPTEFKVFDFWIPLSTHRLLLPRKRRPKCTTFSNSTLSYKNAQLLDVSIVKPSRGLFNKVFDKDSNSSEEKDWKQMVTEKRKKTIKCNSELLLIKKILSWLIRYVSPKRSTHTELIQPSELEFHFVEAGILAVFPP